MLFLPRHSVPMVASTVLVPAGSAWETPETNGAAHFLEHLLFNGTTSRTREEIYATADFLGAYHNASTQRDRTVFQLLLPSENWREGLALQADMLMRSTLPEELFEKERGIILEELAKDRSNPEYEADRFRERSVYGDDARSLAVLGTESSIRGLGVDAVRRFYREHYAPAGLTIVLMGDYDVDEARHALNELFAGDNRVPPALPGNPELQRGLRVQRRSAPGLGKTSVAIDLPLATQDVAAARVLALILSQGERSAVSRALKANDVTPMSAGAHVDFGEPWSRLTISFDVPADTRGGEAGGVPGVSWVLAHLGRFAEIGPGPSEIRAARTACLVEELGLREQMHYYGLMRADILGSAGPRRAIEFTESIPDDPRVYAKLVSEALDAGSLLVCGQGGVDDGEAELEALPSAGGVAWLTKNAVSSERGADARDAITTVAEPVRERVVLANGLTLVHAASPESRTFAAHFLFRDRSAVEAACGAPRGAADVLHRMIGRATAGLGEDSLRGRFNELGAKLKTTDLDWIPYDDYYHSPEYSYARLETIDRFALDALRLTIEAIRRPELNASFLADAVDAAVVRAERDASKPSEVARRAFYETLSPGSPHIEGVHGDANTLRGVTLAQIEDVHRRLTWPRNTILTIASNLPLDAVRRVVEGAYGDGPAEPAATEPLEPAEHATRLSAPGGEPEGRRIVRETGQEQSFVVVGQRILDGANDAALRVASALLSERLAEQLRERDGLAYSIGASYRRDDDPPTLQMLAGTRPENVERMERGMLDVAATLRSSPPTQAEIDGARNREEGRRRMRRITRIGQAFAMGMAEFRKHDPFALDADLAELRAVTGEDVARAAERHLGFDHSTVAIAR